MEPRKGYFEPVSFVQLESDFRMKAERNPVPGPSPAKREWEGWADEMRKKIVSQRSGQPRKKGTFAADTTAPKTKKRRIESIIKSISSRKRRGSGRGRGRNRSRNHDVFSPTPVVRVRQPGSVEDTELEGWDVKPAPIGKIGFFVPPSRIGGLLASWDFLQMHAGILNLPQFSHEELVLALRAREGSSLLDVVFHALLTAVYRIDADNKHVVLSRLTWPHYLRQWLMVRDSWDTDEFEDVTDWLAHSSFYSLPFGRRCDVLGSIVDDVNSSSMVKKLFGRHLARISLLKTTAYKQTAFQRKEEKSFKADSLLLRQVSLCLSRLIGQVDDGQVDENTYAAHLELRHTREMMEGFEEDRRKRECELASQIDSMPVRTTCLGTDRHCRTYFRLGGYKSFLYVCDIHGQWSFIDTRAQFNELLEWLNRLGRREFALYQVLNGMDWKFADESSTPGIQEDVGEEAVSKMAGEDPQVYHQSLLGAETKRMYASHALAVFHASDVEYHRCQTCQEAVGDNEHHCSRCHSSFDKTKTGDRMYSEHVQKCALDMSKSQQLLSDLATLPPTFQVCKALLLDLEAAVPIDACHEDGSGKTLPRDIWINQAKIASRIEELVDLLDPIESGVMDDWLQPWFKRNAWKMELASCRTVHSFAATLLTFDKALLLSEEEYNKCHDTSSASIAPEDSYDHASDASEEGEDTSGGCRLCTESTSPEKLLICDGCNQEYHTFCLEPPLNKVPEGDWHCPSCQSNRRAKAALEALPSRLLPPLPPSESGPPSPTPVLPPFLAQVHSHFQLKFGEQAEVLPDGAADVTEHCVVCLTSEDVASLLVCRRCQAHIHRSCVSEAAWQRCSGQLAYFTCRLCFEEK